MNINKLKMKLYHHMFKFHHKFLDENIKYLCVYQSKFISDCQHFEAYSFGVQPVITIGKKSFKKLVGKYGYKRMPPNTTHIPFFLGREMNIGKFDYGYYIKFPDDYSFWVYKFQKLV